MTLRRRFIITLLTLLTVWMTAASAYAQANIVIQINDAANVGFLDPTPASPVGNNHGTTVGQQRLIAFQFAANIWGATLTSGPTITVRASWGTFSTCTANSGTLASAGAINIFRDFSGSSPGTWYGSALANALRGSDLSGDPEISATFNANLGTPDCLQNLHWYYGLDTAQAGGRVNLVTVILHELSHGLGFQTFTNRSTGIQAGNDSSGRFPTTYDRFLLDITTGKTWPQMTDAERVASAINTGGLVWNGPRVVSDAAQILSFGKDPSGRPFMFTPGTLATGSSVSHWDRDATPNQLMEPNINSNLTHSVSPPQDLTFSLMVDIGWCANCPVPTPTPTPSPPPNDNFALAQTISGCSGSVNGTNVGATREVNEPSHDPAESPGAASVWYQWQAPVSSSVTITTAGSDFDTMLGVYTGSHVANLTTIIKNDDVVLGEIRTSTVTFNATAGTLYKIAVDGWGGETGNIVLNWNVSNCVNPSALIYLESANYTVSEGAGKIDITVFATLAAINATVDYATSDSAGLSNCNVVQGKASSRCDYSQTVGTLSFSAGGTRTITIPITDDSYVEGDEEFTLTLSNPTQAGLGPVTTATIRITDNDTGEHGPNPIDQSAFFVRQHYIDFLNREPDPAGLAFWTNEIDSCGGDAQCKELKRQNVSAAFYLSIEFQQTGYFVYRIYKAAFGDVPVPLNLNQFLPGTQEIGRGVVVGPGNWEAQLNANKSAYAAEFVTREPFIERHPTTLTAGEFVNRLFQNAGMTPTDAARAAAINEFSDGSGGSSADLSARGRALRQVAENATLEQQEFNRAFVLMQYFGYLRRSPNSAPDTNFDGYNFWLNKLNQFNGDFLSAEMVKAFILAGEYRQRFGP